MPQPEQTYLDLRSQALAAADSGLIAPTDEHPRVVGVVVDIPSGGGFATVVALADDTTSLYTSVGGGTIGAGSHAAVAEANHALLSAVDSRADSFTSPDDTFLPPSGSVRFHAVTRAGSRFVDVPEDSFWGRSPHSLMPVIAAAQAVISAISNTGSP